MKRLSIFAIVWCTLLCTSQLFAQNTQLKKWYLNQFAVDFTGATPQVSTLPTTYPVIMGGTSSAQFPENSQGFYDNAGNILFYTAAKNQTSYLDYKVINAQGNIIGSLSNMPQNSPEMSVVPFGCQAPNKYLLIYASYTQGARAPCFSRLVYAVVDLGANTVSPSYQVPGLSSNCPGKAHAVGKPKSDGTRWLYVNDTRNIVKCNIDFTKPYNDLIVKKNNVFTESQVISPVELELSPNQRFLAWSDQEPLKPYHFAVINLDANGDYNGVTKKVTIPTDIASANATGIEFDASGLYLYVGFHTYGQETAKEGIYQYSHLFNSLNLLPNTRGLQKSHIEQAGNGRYYAAKANALVDIRSLASVAVPASKYFPYKHQGTFANYNNINDQGIYRLPDQVDGEVINTNYSLPDISQWSGAICKNDAILNFSSNITNYTITVEKAFQAPCVYQGTARTLDLTTICDIQCGDECNNSIRVTISAELCNGQQLSVQSGVFHILCGPAAPKVKVGKNRLCPNETTWGAVTTNYPQGTTIEWIQGGVVTHTGTNVNGLSGSFTVRVTDANGCSAETSVLLALVNCDLTPFDKKERGVENALKIFPNPAKESVEVQLSSKEAIQKVIIKDKLGAKAKMAAFETNSNTQKLDIRGLKEGVYVLELVTKQGKIYTQKLLVK